MKHEGDEVLEAILAHAATIRLEEVGAGDRGGGDESAPSEHRQSGARPPRNLTLEQRADAREGLLASRDGPGGRRLPGGNRWGRGQPRDQSRSPGQMGDVGRANGQPRRAVSSAPVIEPEDHVAGR